MQDYVVPEKVESAVTLFQHALEKDPTYAAATAGLGEAYWRKYEQSRDLAWAKADTQTCEKATRQGARLAAAYACLAEAYLAQGQYAKAADQFRRTLELEPTSDDAYGGLAAAYEHLGQPADAEQSFKQAIALRPGYWATYNWLSLFYMDHVRYEEAVRQFSQVVFLSPDSFTGSYKLGAVSIIYTTSTPAFTLFEISLDISTTSPS